MRERRERRFRTRPAEIRAIEVRSDNMTEVAMFLGDAPATLAVGPTIAWTFRTAHGEDAIAREGDFIVPEQEPGRFYPVNAETIARKYEEVE